MNSRRSTDFGRCSVAAELGSSDPRMPEDDSICPAFDDGSYDKAVEELVIAWIESSAIIRERCPYEWAFITKALAPFLEKTKERKS